MRGTEFAALTAALQDDSEWSRFEEAEWFVRGIALAEKKRFFHWELEFPEIYQTGDNGGFHAVIGNPPYVSVEKIPKDDLKVITGRFPRAAYGRTDLYLAFMDLAIQRSHGEGYTGFIVPDKWLASDYGERLREHFLDTKTLRAVWDLRKEKVFEDASNAPVVYVVGPETARIEFVEGLAKSILPAQPHALFRALPHKRIRIGLSDLEAQLCAKIVGDGLTLQDFFYVSYGAQPGKLANFVFSSEQDFLQRRANTGNQNVHTIDLKKFVRGRNVQRYFINYGGDLLVYDPARLHRPAFPQLFERPKIMVSEICPDLRATLDTDRFYGNEKVVFAIPLVSIQDLPERLMRDREIPQMDERARIDADISLSVACAVLNSKMMNFYFRRIIGDGLNVYPDDVREIPLRRHRTAPVPTSLVDDALNAAGDLVDLAGMVQRVRGQGGDAQVAGLTEAAVQRMLTVQAAILAERVGFISWLESWTSSRVSEWTGKKALEAIEDCSEAEVLEILKKNKARIRVDPSTRVAKEALEHEMRTSQARLSSLLTSARSLDAVLEICTCTLFGLTADEVNQIQAMA